MNGGATTRREGAEGREGGGASRQGCSYALPSRPPVPPRAAEPRLQQDTASHAPFAQSPPPARGADRHHTSSRCGSSAASHGRVHPSCRVYLLSCLSGSGLQRG